MPQINVKFEESEPVWPDLNQERYDKGEIYHVTETVIEMCVLEGGMVSGRPSISIRIDLPDGKIAIIETSLVAFKAASDLIMEKFGDRI